MTLDEIKCKYGFQNDAAGSTPEDAEIQKKKDEIKKLLMEIKALGAQSEKRTGRKNFFARGILNTMKA